MADETIGNGAPSDVDYQTGEEDVMTRRDAGFFGRDSKVLEINRKIEALEYENSELTRERGKSEGKIKELMEVIEGLRTDGAALKDKQEELQREIEQSSEDKKALQVISARAVELETQVARLQHDLVSSMTESSEAAAELREVKDALEELKQRNLTKEAKVKSLEKEKASLLERIRDLEGEVAEMKKSKSQSEIRIRDLEKKISLMEAREFDNKDQGSKHEEETKAKISEKDGKNLQLQKDIEGLESKVVENTSALQKLQKEISEIEKLNSSLEVALKQSQEKLKETEARANRLQNELAESEKSVRKFEELNPNGTETARELDAVNVEKGSKGVKLQWQTAVVSTGTVAAAAALLYLTYARRR
ncbi:peroxisomal and mitochondrial division factor 2-like [Macadamia integrifolia]|uniref:peroxisomal and mitochondrial division factor 2-like n=1 Tax=Macadamia integrifolia TaxID=60698 RepID=UPI001C530ED7|nr:peroxisomal and mitochondrial division factor 2-like [Macadamia integrifolia]